MMEETQEKIKICMFGKFSITQGQLTIDDSCNRTHQLWNLLEYLIDFRFKNVSQEELVSAIWPDGSSENPANALKKLVYRIRSTFSAYGFSFSRDMIQYHHGSYRWNNNLNCLVDAEEFGRLAKEGAAAENPDVKLEYYLQALDLYQGDFLPGSSCEEWVVPLSTKYRAQYFSIIYETSSLLLSRGAYGEVQRITERAIAIDPFQEQVHTFLIRALIGQDNLQKALDHYRKVTNLFYRELGIKPSESLRSLYQEITKAAGNVETDLDTIREDLIERNQPIGAYYCDYEIFRNLYRMQARAASRNGRSVFVCLFTVTGWEGSPPEPHLRIKAMDKLQECIRLSLRKGDVFSKFSPTQFILMLSTGTFENGEGVLERIRRRFRQDFRNREIIIYSNLQPLLPVEV